MRMLSAGLAAMVFGGMTVGCNTKELGKWDTIEFEQTKKVPFAAKGKETQELLEKLGRAPKEGEAAEKKGEKTDAPAEAAPAK